MAGDAMKVAVTVLEPAIPNGKDRTRLGKFLIGKMEE